MGNILEELINHKNKVNEIYDKLKEADGLAEVMHTIESLNEKEAQDVLKEFVYHYSGLKKRIKQRL